MCRFCWGRGAILRTEAHKCLKLLSVITEPICVLCTMLSGLRWAGRRLWLEVSRLVKCLK